MPKLEIALVATAIDLGSEGKEKLQPPVPVLLTEEVALLEFPEMVVTDVELVVLENPFTMEH